jgi:hypothetical protein
MYLSSIFRSVQVSAPSKAMLCFFYMVLPIMVYWSFDIFCCFSQYLPWARKRSRYSNSLRTTWSGDRIKGGKIFCTHPDRTWDPTPLPVQLVLDLIPESKAAGPWPWPFTSSSAEVKERVELCLSSPSVSSLQVLGWPLDVFLSTSRRTRAQNVRKYHESFLPRTISHSQSILLRAAISARRLINRC